MVNPRLEGVKFVVIGEASSWEFIPLQSPAMLFSNSSDCIKNEQSNSAHSEINYTSNGL